MPLPAGAHVKIGDKNYRLDESQEAPYRRFSRSIFADVPLVGSIGQNLQPGRLVWNQTNFDGEGQVVLDVSDTSSARRFYRSSGLDFKTAGQFQLNKGSVLTLPTPTGATATTVEANAGFSDVTGTSTTSLSATSGTTWDAETSGTSSAIYSVAWSANEAQFVAVGATGLILTSPDAATWTSRTSGTTADLRGVARSENDDLWVAVGGDGGVILTSPNGVTWTSRTSGVTRFLKGIACSEADDLWVAVGGASNQNYVLTSPDGTTWTSRTHTVTNPQAVARSENDDLWVAVGKFGTLNTSPDGTTWTSRTSGTTNDLTAVARSDSDDLWVIGGTNGTLRTSPDGTTWTARTSGTTSTVLSLAYAAGVWIAGLAGGGILTSTNGTTWTARTSGITADVNGAAYSAALVKSVVVGSSGKVLTSTGFNASTTDRQLNALADVVKATSDHTPGATTVTVDFYAYRSPLVNVAGQANPTVTLTVYNVTDSAVVATKTATLSSTTTSLVSTISFTAVAAKAYSYRFTWTSGTGNKPIADKIVYSVPSSSGIYTHEAIELGQGGTVWVAASSSTAATDTTTYTYDFSNDAWTNRQSPTSTNNKKPLALAHTDKYEYVLLDNSIVYQVTTAAVNAYIAATTATARGMTITQNRLFVLGEDATNGVIVYLYGLDQGSYPVAVTNSVTVDNGKNSPDATLRQRMTASPTGARFFVNSSTRSTIYQCDASDASPIVTILAELPEGVKATSILHTGGLTFVAGQFLAPTGSVSRSALFMIDQNGVIQRIGWFRRDDPNANPVIAMQAFQNDLWMLQGPLVWRYSLTTGGLFLEQTLDPTTASSARGIAVTQDYAFAAYDSGVYVVGKSDTYVSTGSPSLTSSVYDFGLPYEQKLLQSLEVTTYQLPANTSVLVEYQLDQNGVWVTAGTSSSGTLHHFRISDAIAATRFYTLQTRVTPQSTTGVSTPVVKGITAQCYTTTTEELFDLALLTTDQDSETPLAGEDKDGADLAAYIWELASSDALVTLYDGYSVGPYEEPREFLCKIESVDHINMAPSEGSVRVRLRVVT